MYDSYLICTSPRSGSTLLCRMLSDTGVAGAPNSFFHGPTLQDWAEGLELELEPDTPEHAQIAQVFHAAIAKGRGDRLSAPDRRSWRRFLQKKSERTLSKSSAPDQAAPPLFGTRLQGHSLAPFRTQLARLYPDLSEEAARVTQAFGRTAFIHLTREDKLAQAVSYVKAQQSGLWHRNADGSELERLAPPQPPAFDRDRIAAQIAKFETMDADWRAWFAALGVTPLRVTYAALSADPHATLAKVLSHIGQDPARAEAVIPNVARLSDDVNADWIRRFRAAC